MSVCVHVCMCSCGSSCDVLIQSRVKVERLSCTSEEIPTGPSQKTLEGRNASARSAQYPTVELYDRLGLECAGHSSVFVCPLQFEFLLSQKPGHSRIEISLLQPPHRCQLLAELILAQQSGIIPSCVTILGCPELLV